MMSLFHTPPLSERMRPLRLSDISGQSHLLGEGRPFIKLITSGTIPSMIFWGPPGVGKTTLAQVIAAETKRTFYSLSAISSGVKDVREIIEKAERSGNAIVFIDEIHRFNKTQQDSLLGAVEKGIITLIGATTENPSFEVISALLSRCQVYILEPLEEEELLEIIHHAIKNDIELGKKRIEIVETESLLRLSGGDARKLLNLLEIVVLSEESMEVMLTNKRVEEVVQLKMALYDKSGEMHYDIISAFIKSIRGSDPNGAIYYLARMIEGGEDPKFIARRLLILASEDIGIANPNALLLATSCFQAVSIIGYPECDLILSQTVIFLATSPKSNSAYKAIREAQQLVKQTGDLPIPLSIRNSPTKLMKEIGYGKGYQYAHDYEGNFSNMEFLPTELIGTTLYQPGDNQREREVRNQLKKWWGEKYGY